MIGEIDAGLHLLTLAKTGESDPYLGRASRHRVCNHGGSHTNIYQDLLPHFATVVCVLVYRKIYNELLPLNLLLLLSHI